MCLCSGCCVFCLYCEAWSCRCSCMGSVSVSSCICLLLVSCVHPVAVLNAAFCMTCSLLMLLEDARGDHMEEAYSRAGLITATSRKFNTGVPQGSQLSLSLFSFNIADMPRPNDDDLTVWTSGVNIPDLDAILNNYLEEITAYMNSNSLLIFAQNSSVTLLTPDTHQAETHPSILIEGSRIPLVKFPRILGVYLEPSLSFNKHSQYVAERVSGRNNTIMSLAGTS